jgi:ubiquinol-cytochrome c reductase iron-sulfur subunit
MAHLPRFARLAALPVVAAVALAIVLPGVVKAATSSPTPTSAASPAGGIAASPGAAATPATISATPATFSATPAPGSGAAIYAANCSGCHGDHGQGLIGPSQQADAFPALVAGMIKRGGISMPAFRQFSPAQVAAVSNFVATQIADPVARTATIAEGGRLFRLYCSGCHSSTGRGGALSQGRNAPSLADYPAAEALAAMILGRGNMPNFAGTTFNVRQQASVALYVQLLQAPPSPGGWGLGYIGPVTEGLACFAALGLLVLLTVWLAWGKGQVRPTAPAPADASPPAVVATASGGARGDASGTAVPLVADALQSPAGPPSPADDRPAFVAPGWPAAIGLLVAIAGAAGFVAFFIAGNNAQKLGGTMALSFLGLGFALAYWGRDLTSDEVEVGHYPLPPEPAAESVATLGPAAAAPSAGTVAATTGLAPAPADVVSAQLGDELARSTNVLTRRRFLTALLVGAATAVGLSQLALAASLGPKSRGMFSTAWRPGVRLVTTDGVPISHTALQGGGVIVAFPEGHLEAADSQVSLLRLTGVAPQPGRGSWSPESFFAYSRVCTHAGCAVAQYEDESQVLLCPCHQSTFDLRQGARPISGPAARPLPQLPLAIDANGYLIAQGDFNAPIGPGFWNLYA